MLALITGTVSQPSTAPAHHTGTLRPRARIRFSVLMDSSRLLQITRTRLRGGGRTVTAKLPARWASPVHSCTAPSARSPPPGRERSRAGRAALYMLAMRLMQAKNRMRSSTPRFAHSHRSPSPADWVREGRAPPAGSSGRRMNSPRLKTAAAQGNRSKAITASSPARASRAAARAGPSRVTREPDRARSPPTRWAWSLGVSRVAATSLTGC